VHQRYSVTDGYVWLTMTLSDVGSELHIIKYDQDKAVKGSITLEGQEAWNVIALLREISTTLLEQEKRSGRTKPDILELPTVLPF